MFKKKFKIVFWFNFVYISENLQRIKASVKPMSKHTIQMLYTVFDVLCNLYKGYVLEVNSC